MSTDVGGAGQALRRLATTLAGLELEGEKAADLQRLAQTMSARVARTDPNAPLDTLWLCVELQADLTTLLAEAVADLQKTIAAGSAPAPPAQT